MEFRTANVLTAGRATPAVLAQRLIRLFGERFGGPSSGKFRISRKFLRKLAGRRKLPDSYLAALAEEMFEAGFVFVDCESYSIVLSQKPFASYRRVTSLAANRAMTHERAYTDPRTADGTDTERPDISEFEEGSVQTGPEIH